MSTCLCKVSESLGWIKGEFHSSLVEVHVTELNERSSLTRRRVVLYTFKFTFICKGRLWDSVGFTVKHTNIGGI